MKKYEKMIETEKDTFIEKQNAIEMVNRTKILIFNTICVVLFSRLTGVGII